MKFEDDPSAVLQVPRLTPGAQRIVDVASQLFYRHGIHAVGVDTIAAASGITKRTLYDRFGSKDQLVAVYLQVRHQRWWDRMERRLTHEPEAPVLALFDSYAEDSETSDRGCAFINAAAELSVDHPAYRVIRAHKQAVLDRLVQLLGTGSAADHEDTVAVAQEIYLLLEGAIAHRGIDGDDRLLRRAREVTKRLIDDRGLNASGGR
ncbi:TetR/AcrR family transcriptional regulator [Propionimicrobium sp. PCR01-08-3]|uniref:TetR/AcrR family transcriptional regulator n=1 Tax=Propionimicrobium sp. PCR01-08-3 TaxID=3052086 RepID=UPI00255C9453|nr:TetR/AcrR family transcriptional regulator [Propionimicrobium sp. PCR01-08-3]WIY82902.1 TetR/AcrR family transcriptional regulator [Propionimicrobium sp. PCR01-08-3]